MAAAPAAGPDVPGAPDDAQLAGKVLVWADARFYLGPTEDAPSFQLSTLRGPRSEHVGLAVPMRVISNKGPLVEVESSSAAPDVETGCAWYGLSTPSDLEPLRLFVRRADIAPVVKQQFAKTYPDGTKLQLEPGMPVAPLPDGRYRVELPPLVLEAAIDSTSIGHAYDAALRTWSKSAPQWALERGVAVTLAGDAYSTDRLRFDLKGARLERRGDVALLSFGTSCGSAVVAAPADKVKKLEPRKSGESAFGLGGLGSGATAFVPRGTPLETPSGHLITRARTNMPVKTLPQGDARICFLRSVSVSTPYAGAPKVVHTKPIALRLCAPASAVKPYKGSYGGGGAQ